MATSQSPIVDLATLEWVVSRLLPPGIEKSVSAQADGSNWLFFRNGEGRTELKAVERNGEVYKIEFNNPQGSALNLALQ